MEKTVDDAIALALTAAASTMNTTFDKQYKASVSLMLKTALVHALGELQTVIDNLKSEVATLKQTQAAAVTASTGTHQLNFAAIVSSEKPEHVQQRHQVINFVAAEQKERAERESNVVVVGLPNSEDDNAAAAAFFAAIGTQPTIKSVRRLRGRDQAHGKNTIVNDANKHGLLLVTFASQDEQRKILQRGRHHAAADYDKVFVREDRTAAQQAEFVELTKKMRAKNNELQAANLLDQPFRYIIHRRDREVRCIDAKESATQKRCVWRKPHAASARN